MSFAQLEEAARNSIEIDADENAKKGTVAGKGKKPGSKQAQPGRDDEMSIYLSEIRQKQEILINRLRQDNQNTKVQQQVDEQDIEESATGFKEESKHDAQSSVASQKGGLRDKRNLIPTKKSAAVEESNVAAVSQQDELAQLRAELEREKAEKKKLAEQVAAQKSS